MGWTKGNQVIAQCEIPTCQKWRIGDSTQLKTMSHARYQEMISEGLISREEPFVYA